LPGRAVNKAVTVHIEVLRTRARDAGTEVTTINYDTTRHRLLIEATCLYAASARVRNRSSNFKSPKFFLHNR
jgi:hypothetical protein